MTLQEVTLAHSRRMSELHQRRDGDLRDALLTRDAHLRQLPAAQELYAQLDLALAKALNDKQETESKAAVARANALEAAGNTRSEALAAALGRRKSTDLETLERRRTAEAAAEKAFRDRISAISPTATLELRQRTMQEADRERRQALEAARVEHEKGIAKSLATHRKEVDSALGAERSSEQTAEQSHAAALRVAAASYNAAIASAERTHLTRLAQIPEARAQLTAFEQAVVRIRRDTAAGEERLFERFREELRRVGETT
jgi:hypothetical protein